MRECGKRKESCERFDGSGINTVHQSGKHLFADRMKFQDSTGIRTQDLLTYQSEALTTEPLGPLAEEEQKTSYISNAKRPHSAEFN